MLLRLPAKADEGVSRNRPADPVVPTAGYQKIMVVRTVNLLDGGLTRLPETQRNCDRCAGAPDTRLLAEHRPSRAHNPRWYAGVDRTRVARKTTAGSGARGGVGMVVSYLQGVPVVDGRWLLWRAHMTFSHLRSEKELHIAKILNFINPINKVLLP